tara:strand:- start:81 stop:386 length:306 start_codon:yes stop_codon:yes gene_type:complete
MKKYVVISLIVILILFTAIVKNSTKRIDDEIFTVQENIRIFKKDFENEKLEYEYLSSAELLLEYQKKYFENHLKKKDINKIKTLKINSDKFEIIQLKINNE